MISKDKEKFKVVLIMTLICILWSIPNYALAATITPVMEDRERIVLIDPGHGGIDGGAEVRNSILEKELNLNVSLKLRDKLNSMGYKVIMTREEDKGLYRERGGINSKKQEDLSNRCKMKGESNCDIFISIHQNFFDESCYYGAQVWYSKNKDSEKLAHIIQENLKRDLDKNNKRVEKPAGNSYKVLRCYSSIPSVIVECGFLTNPQELKKLTNEEYQDKIADSLSKSVQDYFGGVEDVGPNLRKFFNKL